MSDTLLRLLRLLQLIPRAPRKADVSALLAKLEEAGHRTTRRTLQRDLNTLSGAFPIQCDSSSIPYGWSWLANTESLELPQMDGHQALMLKMVEQFIPALMPPELKHYLRPYFARADAVLTQHSQLGKRRWLNRVRIVPCEMPLLSPKVNAKVTETVYQALIDGRRFTAVYMARSAEEDPPKTYQVNPLGLVVRGSITYLVCTLRDYTDIRQLAVHRIKEAVLSDTAATQPPDFDLDKYIEQGEFQYPHGPTIKFKVIFDRGAAAHLYETPLSVDQSIKDIDDSRVMVTAKVRHTAQLEWWLLGFAELVEVISPQKLRMRIATHHAKAAQYNSSPAAKMKLPLRNRRPRRLVETT